MKSIVRWEDAAKLAEEVSKKGGTVVTTNGCFDILHRGHVSYLKASRELGDCLIVAINSDASVKKIKGPDRPINNEADRATVLAALRFVDAVCVFDEPTPVEFLKTIRPKIHTKGGDYKGQNIPEIETLAAWGGQVSFIEFLQNYSTTKIIARMKG